MTTLLEELHCNSGAGRPSYRISASLLGNASHRTSWGKVISVGLIFSKDQDPAEACWKVLREAGWNHPEDLRSVFAPEAQIYTVRLLDEEKEIFPKVGESDVNEVLKNALLLGLATTQYFDTSRPVIWTASRLNRQLELFDVGGFYELD